MDSYLPELTKLGYDCVLKDDTALFVKTSKYATF